jgi:hypothetical protein
MSDASITAALHQYGMLDREGFIVPPYHPNVNALTSRMAQLMELSQSGLKLTPEDKLRLKTMHMVFDYYNEALHDLEDDGEYLLDEDDEGDGFVDDGFVDAEDTSLDEDEDEESILDTPDSDELSE